MIESRKVQFKRLDIITVQVKCNQQVDAFSPTLDNPAPSNNRNNAQRNKAITRKLASTLEKKRKWNIEGAKV